MKWDLDDLAGLTELAAAHKVTRAAVGNWANRFDDFPAPLKELAAGSIYSRKQVAAWHKRHFGARADRMRERADELERTVARLRKRAARYDTA